MDYFGIVDVSRKETEVPNSADLGKETLISCLSSSTPGHSIPVELTPEEQINLRKLLPYGQWKSETGPFVIYVGDQTYDLKIEEESEKFVDLAPDYGVDEGDILVSLRKIRKCFKDFD